MAAVPLGLVSSPGSYSKRPPLALSAHRLEANRRNAARSTGPRTPKGKARVARNAIKHGFFADAERWTEQQHRDFGELFDGLCHDFEPRSRREEICVAIIADSYVRIAAMLRYENIAALKYHRQCERELNERIAAAGPAEAADLEAGRETLRRAGLWTPTIPGPREAVAIIRYEGRLRRVIGAATAELDSHRALRKIGKAQKQTHFIQQSQGIFASMPLAEPATIRCETSSSSVLSAARRTSNATTEMGESAKTNPLNSMFMGNRHQRRRAKALARRRT